jgi:hypothetical protein
MIELFSTITSSCSFSWRSRLPSGKTSRDLTILTRIGEQEHNTALSPIFATNSISPHLVNFQRKRQDIEYAKDSIPSPRLALSKGLNRLHTCGRIWQNLAMASQLVMHLYTSLRCQFLRPRPLLSINSKISNLFILIAYVRLRRQDTLRATGASISPSKDSSRSPHNNSRTQSQHTSHFYNRSVASARLPTTRTSPCRAESYQRMCLSGPL